MATPQQLMMPTHVNKQHTELYFIAVSVGVSAFVIFADYLQPDLSDYSKPM